MGCFLELRFITGGNIRANKIERELDTHCLDALWGKSCSNFLTHQSQLTHELSLLRPSSVTNPKQYQWLLPGWDGSLCQHLVQVTETPLIT